MSSQKVSPKELVENSQGLTETQNLPERLKDLDYSLDRQFKLNLPEGLKELVCSWDKPLKLNLPEGLKECSCDKPAELSDLPRV